MDGGDRTHNLRFWRPLHDRLCFVHMRLFSWFALAGDKKRAAPPVPFGLGGAALFGRSVLFLPHGIAPLVPMHWMGVQSVACSNAESPDSGFVTASFERALW